MENVYREELFGKSSGSEANAARNLWPRRYSQAEEKQSCRQNADENEEDS